MFTIFFIGGGLNPWNHYISNVSIVMFLFFFRESSVLLSIPDLSKWYCEI